MTRTPAHIASRFCRERSGSVAVVFGIAAIPVTLAMGAAVDYSLASRAKTTLDTYADAAALSAVGKNYQSLPPEIVKVLAANFFKARAIDLKRGRLKLVGANVTDTATGRTVAIKYVAQVPTSFMGLVSINNITVEGTATAYAGLPTTQTVRTLVTNGVRTRTITVNPSQLPRLTN